MNRRPVVGFLLAALIFAVVVAVSDPKSLAQVKEVRLAPAILVFGMTGLMALAASWRWKVVLHGLQPGVAFPLLAIFRVMLLGLTFGIVVPQDVGLATSRITYLTRDRKMTAEQAMFSTFLDRWFDVVALAVVAPACALFVFSPIGREYALAIMLISVTTLLVASLVWPTAVTSLFTIGFALVTSVICRVLRRGTPTMLEPGGQPFQTLPRTQLFYVLILSLARIAMVSLRAWLVMIALGIDLGFATVLLLVPVPQTTLLIPFIPGGLGPFDAGWYGILLLHGVSTADSLSFMLMHRVLDILSVLVMVALTEIVWVLSKRLRRPAPTVSGD